ncbi:YbhN family protein [Phenylobacterium sp.]|uniref:lysylphosphatidylglycerol synthase transmembrane domain-containing protein n=1 Tax=Phenylobacterium sp. TaxID=1871053 RepID=UPI002C921D8B|nr:YbhN family protein [Phenylobacterium sp.]HVI30919.1 YbhN family protein [Phenylobacterium sp.]
MPTPDPPPHAEAPADHPLEDELAQALPDRRTTLPVLIRRWALRLIPVILLGAAGYVLWRDYHDLAFADVAAEVRRWGHRAILGALALSAVSFLLMGVVEKVGLRWMGARLPWAPTLATAFIANAIAHSLGANLLVSGAVRARLYDRYGVGLTQVAGATLFQGFSFAVGIATLAGAGLLLASPQALAASAIATPVARTTGAVLLAAVAAYLLTCALHRTPLHAFGRTLALPSPGKALVQLSVGAADNATAAAIIWILLPPGTVDYLAFVGAYAIACVAGLISTVPAGAGVFEGTLSALLPRAPAASLAAAFLGYRLAYFLLPLAVALLALLGDTLRRPRRR